MWLTLNVDYVIIHHNHDLYCNTVTAAKRQCGANQFA